MQAILRVYPVLIDEVCLLGLMYIVTYLRFFWSYSPNEILSIRNIKWMLSDEFYARLIKISTGLVALMIALTITSGFVLQNGINKLDAAMESIQQEALESNEIISE